MKTSFQKALGITFVSLLLGQVFHLILHQKYAFKGKLVSDFFKYNMRVQRKNFTLERDAPVKKSDYTTNHVLDRSNSSDRVVPDLCVIITFPPTSDPLKHQVHTNTAKMYESLFPRVQAFLSKPVPQEALALNMSVLEAPSTNAHGTPLFASLISMLETACPDSPLLAYANSDILFDTSLLHTLDALLDWNQPEFMAVGCRRNHILQGPLTIHDIAQVPSELFTHAGQDYFIFSRHLAPSLSLLPPYVIGRRAYDNAVNDWAFHRSILVDLTDTVIALHQTTSDGDKAGFSEKNPDKEYNVQLPDAQYDHWSTLLGQYATVHRDGRVVVLRRKDNAVMTSKTDPLQIIRRGQPLALESLPPPLLVTSS
jgi:hypothetical protein